MRRWEPSPDAAAPPQALKAALGQTRFHVVSNTSLKFPSGVSSLLALIYFALCAFLAQQEVRSSGSHRAVSLKVWTLVSETTWGPWGPG